MTFILSQHLNRSILKSFNVKKKKEVNKRKEPEKKAFLKLKHFLDKIKGEVDFFFIIMKWFFVSVIVFGCFRCFRYF